MVGSWMSSLTCVPFSFVIVTRIFVIASLSFAHIPRNMCDIDCGPTDDDGVHHRGQIWWVGRNGGGLGIRSFHRKFLHSVLGPCMPLSFTTDFPTSFTVEVSRTLTYIPYSLRRVEPTSEGHVNMSS